MNKCPYCEKKFTEWKSIRGHIPSCKNNTGEYFISLEYGPIHYSFFIGKNAKQVNVFYPRIESLGDIRKAFKRRGIDVGSFEIKYSRDSLIGYIQKFYLDNNRIPQSRDFKELSKKNSSWPNERVYREVFKTWNNAIEEAGFTPNYNDGYGIRSKGLDGILYRSNYEVYFVNNYLYNQYEYVAELRYPEPYNRFYDWYIPELDLYIELDGGIRPQVIQEKIKINKELNRELWVIPTNSITSKTKLEDFKVFCSGARED